MLRRHLFRASVSALAVSFGLSVVAASPASARPAQVGAPWVKAASTTSLTLDWSAVKGAKRYQVFFATGYEAVKKSSAKSRTTSGSQSELRITGLKPRTMYCFMVRAVGKGTGNRSHRHCKFTMRSTNRTRNETASVATYNICSQAGPCGATWNRRLPAIKARIADAKVDVLALQETSRRAQDMARELAGLGFAMASTSGTEGIYYRTSRFSVATRTETSTVTKEVRYTGDTSTWDTESGTHLEGGVTYSYDRPDQGGQGIWMSDQPVVTTREVPDVGEWYLGGSADAAWARLKSTRTGRTFLFVSAHVQTGKKAANSAQRRRETTQLVAFVKAKVKQEPTLPASRTIIAGDFNSQRNRPDDSPRKVLESSGWHDVYDRSSTFTYPKYNSYNGYKTTPNTSERYGDHVDRIFVMDQVGSTGWKVVHKFTKVNGKTRYATPIGSDHSPVRATLYLP